MMAGQIAMICAPLAMAQLSKHKLNTPFLVSGCFGLIVVICMFWFLVLLEGKCWEEHLEKNWRILNHNQIRIVILSWLLLRNGLFVK